MTEPQSGREQQHPEPPVLTIENLSCAFGALLASDSINLQVRRDEIHALIGPNGAGKTTLIKQVAGEISPDSGDIYFAGQRITPLDATERVHLGLARSFQISALAAEMTALENVMLAVLGHSGRVWRFFAPVMKHKAMLKQAEYYLQQVGLVERRHILAANLSHGERRQLEIALALALKPKLFLLDEPMAGIGSGGSKKLTRLLDKLRREAPILLVEHDMDAVFALADRISVLVYGRVIATGSVAEIRANPQVREAYLGGSAQ